MHKAHVKSDILHNLCENCRLRRFGGYIKGAITGTCSEPDTGRVHTATIED